MSGSTVESGRGDGCATSPLLTESRRERSDGVDVREGQVGEGEQEVVVEIPLTYDSIAMGTGGGT